MTFLRTARNSIGCLLLAGTLAFLTGCGTAATSKSANSTALTKPADNTPPPYDPLRIGDRISVEFSGAPTALPPVQTDIKSDGTIRLDFVGDVKADGKTPGQLEKEIREKYVPDYYTHLNVTVTPTIRYFYVQGEVNGTGGGRIPWTGQITVTRAIAAAGDFNPFANRSKVKVIRADGSIVTVNCIKAIEHPELDLPVYPNDKIVIKRRFF